MNDKILNHFTPGPSKDEKTQIDYLIEGFEYHLPINKFYDFWCDYLSIDHNLIVFEIPSNYTAVIIDFWAFSELNNKSLGDICAKIIEKIKKIVTCTAFDFTCYIFKNTEDDKKIRLIFPHFFMKKSIIDGILFNSVHKKYLGETSKLKMRALSIPSVVNFFDERSGLNLYGIVNRSKFRTIKRLDYSFVHKHYEEDIFYATYSSLSKQYANKKLYPIIFSININKPILKSILNTKNKPRYIKDVLEYSFMNQFKNIYSVNEPIMYNCLLKCDNDNVEVSATDLRSVFHNFEKLNRVYGEFEKINCSRVPILNSKNYDTIPSSSITIINLNFFENNLNLGRKDRDLEKKKTILESIYNQRNDILTSLENTDHNDSFKEIFKNIFKKERIDVGPIVSEVNFGEENDKIVIIKDENYFKTNLAKKFESWLENHFIPCDPNDIIKTDEFYDYYKKCECEKCFTEEERKFTHKKLIENMNIILDQNKKYDFISTVKKYGKTLNGNFYGGLKYVDHQD